MEQGLADCALKCSETCLIADRSFDHYSVLARVLHHNDKRVTWRPLHVKGTPGQVQAYNVPSLLWVNDATMSREESAYMQKY